MGHFKDKIGNAHVRCHVTGWYGVIQNDIFGISDPNLPTDHYITFMGLQRRFKGVYIGAPPL